MTGALNALRQGAVDLLKEYGLNAVMGMEPERAGRWREPVVAVSLRKVVCAAGGFKDYLGVRENPSTGLEEELYGRAAELTLALDIYAPRDGGEGACQETLAAMTEALMCRGVAGLSTEEVRADRVEFLEKAGLYRLQVSCLCRAWLVAAAEDGGAFVDIEVKGRKV